MAEGAKGSKEGSSNGSCRVTLHACGKVVYQWKNIAKMGVLLEK